MWSKQHLPVCRAPICLVFVLGWEWEGRRDRSAVLSTQTGSSDQQSLACTGSSAGPAQPAKSGGKISVVRLQMEPGLCQGWDSSSPSSAAKQLHEPFVSLWDGDRGSAGKERWEMSVPGFILPCPAPQTCTKPRGSCASPHSSPRALLPLSHPVFAILKHPQPPAPSLLSSTTSLAGLWKPQPGRL